MAADYEKVYRESRHALGDPSSELVRFFESYGRNDARILDVGCGQGRDALYVARLGHRVTGIDQSPSGIRDLLKDAKNEGLAIEAEVTDIRTYTPEQDYDVVIIDRTLHMLNPEPRLSVLSTMSGAVNSGGFLLIADEASNIPAFESLLNQSKHDWIPLLKRRGYLFVQRKGP
jgi:2-polyprenyl-3-methyl-5-hydroxy-6-metoxy-1,4-benzoquinol methylase